MSRLYEAKVDEKRWKIIEIDNENYHTYKLIDKEKEEIYVFNNVIGVEQITEDEFLVYDRYNCDQFRIARYKAENSKFNKLFEVRFSNFYFITNDRILLTYWDKSSRYRSSGIYSIKDNGYVEDGKWLNGMAIELFNYEDNADEIGLYVEEEIVSCKLGHPKLLFTVDPNTLQPNSDCYSELRDSFIRINNDEDIKNLKLEEQRSIRVIEEHIYQKECEKLQDAKQKILVRNKNQSSNRS